MKFKGDGEPGDDPKAPTTASTSGLPASSACSRRSFDCVTPTDFAVFLEREPAVRDAGYPMLA
jgi:hypothetical protein